MENSKIKFTHTYKYPFNECIQDVWDTLKNVSIVNRVLSMVIPEFASEPIFIRGEKSYELDSEFFLYFNKTIRIYMQTKEIEECENFKYIKWRCVSYRDGEKSYDYSYTLASGEKENSTLLLIRLDSYSEREGDYASEETLIKQDFFIFSTIDKYLTLVKSEKQHSETINVESYVEDAFNCILNMKTLQKNVEYICDKISYPGNQLKLGTKLCLEWNLKQKLKVDLIVTKLNKNLNYCSLCYQSISSFPIVPEQTVEWTVEKIKDRICKITIIHKYKDVVKSEVLQSLSKMKRDMLMCIKSVIETHSSI